MKTCWFTFAVLLFWSGPQAQSHSAAQTPEEVKAVLTRWNWGGDWFQDCRHKDHTTHMIGSVGASGVPIVTVYIDGTFASEHQITSAEISKENYLITTEEARIESYLVERLKAVWERQKSSIHNMSSEIDVEALDDVPPNVLSAKPEGMVRGTHLHFRPVRDGMLVNSFGRPTKLAVVYYRCGEPSS